MDGSIRAFELRDRAVAVFMVGFRVRLVIRGAPSPPHAGSSLVFFLYDLNPLVGFYAHRRDVTVDKRH